MRYEDKIYDITALEMFKRLEVFLTEMGVSEYESVRFGGKTRRKPLKFSDRAEAFESSYPGRAMPEISRLMFDINKTRNKIAHPPDLKQLVDFSIEPIVVLQRDGFEDFRKKCLRLEKLLNRAPFNKHTGMGEIMIPTLGYEMGNLGDIVKHGLLAEFVDWWCLGPNPRMVFADTFAGSPWGGNKYIDSRMQKLSGASNGKTALVRAYKAGEGEKYPLYLGSSHLAKRIAKIRNKDIALVVSDRSKDARNNLAASGLKLASFPDNNDGFAILDKPAFPKYKPTLILLDSYGGFLREQWHDDFGMLYKVADMTEEHPNLWVVLFVLDMWPETDGTSRKTVQETHDRYIMQRDRCFKGKAVYLRCPKAEESPVKGEKKYDAEVLLISKRLADANKPNIKDLTGRLKAVASATNAALAKERMLTLAGNRKVEYGTV